MNVIDVARPMEIDRHPSAEIFPRDLSGAEIEQLLPHRGGILFAQQMRLLGPDYYLGFVVWEETSMGIAGHFPSMPIIPAVYLIEAAAQFAGAGMLASKTDLGERASDRIGVLAGVRRCTFKKPVFPGKRVTFEITVKPGSGGFAFAEGVASVDADQVASFDLIVAFAERQQIFPPTSISA